MTIMSISMSLFLASLLASPITAWPTGAGSCPKGKAAVGGAHLNATDSKLLTSGFLEDAGIKVNVNGQPVSNGATVSVGETAQIQLMSDNPFKGFLIRLGPFTDGTVTGDLTTALNPLEDGGTNVKLEELYCIPSGVAGVTHTANDDKDMIAASLDVTEAADYMLDVTVVMENDATESKYFFTSYTIAAVAGQTNGTAPMASNGTSSGTVTEATDAPKATGAPKPASGSIMTTASTLVAVAASSVLVALVF